MAQKLPYPSVNFPNLVQQAMADASSSTRIMEYERSGELTSSLSDIPVGVVVEPGTIADFVVALANQGRDDTNTLTVAVTLKKNGVTVHSGGTVTLEGASGEAGAYTFNVSAPTFNVTSVVRGDLLTLDATVVRTASPTTEMKHLQAAVKIVPTY